MFKTTLIFCLICHINGFSQKINPSGIQIYSGINSNRIYLQNNMYQLGIHRITSDRVPLVIGVEFSYHNSKKQFELAPIGNYEIKSKATLINYSFGVNSFRKSKFNLYWGISLNHVFFNNKLITDNEKIKELVKGDYQQGFARLSFLFKPQFYINDYWALYSRINFLKVKNGDANLYVSLGLAYLINDK
jgi:hypothetical protein